MIHVRVKSPPGQKHTRSFAISFALEFMEKVGLALSLVNKYSHF